jgi:condensin complex subunit 1
LWEQSKKFAKPEMKLCIDEFEDKLNKFHVEKKEQEVTARNAQIHQQRVGSMEGLSVAGNNGEDSAESDTAEGYCNWLMLWFNVNFFFSFFMIPKVP